MIHAIHPHIVGDKVKSLFFIIFLFFMCSVEGLLLHDVLITEGFSFLRCLEVEEDMLVNFFSVNELSLYMERLVFKVFHPQLVKLARLLRIGESFF